MDFSRHSSKIIIIFTLYYKNPLKPKWRVTKFYTLGINIVVIGTCRIISFMYSIPIQNLN